MSVATQAPQGAPGTKGLKTGTLGFVSNIVIGVASTAPAYSLAVSLGLVVAAVGFASPAIMWLAFLPMLAVAFGVWWVRSPAFFRNRPEVLPAGATVPPAATGTP